MCMLPFSSSCTYSIWGYILLWLCGRVISCVEPNSEGVHFKTQSAYGSFSLQLLQSLADTDSTELSEVWNTKTPRSYFIDVWMCTMLWPASVWAFRRRWWLFQRLAVHAWLSICPLFTHTRLIQDKDTSAYMKDENTLALKPTHIM